MAFPTIGEHTANSRDAGYVQGRAAGYAAGLKEAAKELAVQQARHESEHAEALNNADRRTDTEVTALARAVEAVQALVTPVVEDAESSMAAAAVELAEKIIGIALEDESKLVASILARSTDITPMPVSLKVHPSTAPLISSHVPTTVLVTTDNTVGPMDVQARYPDGFLDGRIASALQRVKTALDQS